MSVTEEYLNWAIEWTPIDNGIKINVCILGTKYSDLSGKLYNDGRFEADSLSDVSFSNRQEANDFGRLLDHLYEINETRLENETEGEENGN